MNQASRSDAPDPEEVAERLALEITEEIVRLMERRGMTRERLATAMDVTPTFVSRMLNATPAMTLQTIARCAVALNARPKLTLAIETPEGPSAEAKRRLDLGIAETSEPREMEH